MIPLIMSVLYVWAQLNRDMIVSFWFGTRFKVCSLVGKISFSFVYRNPSSAQRCTFWFIQKRSVQSSVYRQAPSCLLSPPVSSANPESCADYHFSLPQYLRFLSHVSLEISCVYVAVRGKKDTHMKRSLLKCVFIIPCYIFYTLEKICFCLPLNTYFCAFSHNFPPVTFLKLSYSFKSYLFLTEHTYFLSHLPGISCAFGLL